MRDVFFHTQFCAVLGMVAVQWPVFACAFFVAFFNNLSRPERSHAFTDCVVGPHLQ